MTINLGRYAAAFVLMSVLLWLVWFLLEIFAGFEGGSAAGAVIPPMLAAVVEGHRRAKVNGEPYPPEIWRMALEATGVVFVLNLILLGVMIATTDVAGLVARKPVVFFIVFMLLILASFFANRIGFGMGIKLQLEKQAKS